MRLFRELRQDSVSLACRKPDGTATLAQLAQSVSYDGFVVLALSRVRQSARRLHIPLVNRTLRLSQMALFGIEIAKDVELGEGVFFMHTLGTVIGGNSKIGARTLFLGNNTIGNLNNRGYPVIEEDVIIGAGARKLGPVVIGRGAMIGANAVVVTDVPAGATAVGIPAVSRLRGTSDGSPPSSTAVLRNSVQSD